MSVFRIQWKKTVFASCFSHFPVVVYGALQNVMRRRKKGLPNCTYANLLWFVSESPPPKPHVVKWVGF